MGVIGISCFASVLTLILNFILRQIMMAFARYEMMSNYEMIIHCVDIKDMTHGRIMKSALLREFVGYVFLLL